MLPIVVGAFVTVTKDLEKRLQEVEIRESVEIIQTATC